MSRRRAGVQPPLLGPTEPNTGGASLLTADEAARELGVSKPTLYAYVSRGLLRAVPDPADPRASRYPAFEVALLMRRRGQGRKREQQTLGALNNGWPVLETALAAVVDGQPVYRGQAAVPLAREHSAEDAARLLWQFGAHDPFAAPAPVLSPAWHHLATEIRARPLAERTLALFALALSDLHGSAWLPDGPALAQACGAHLRAAWASFLALAPQDRPLHEQVARAWGLPRRAHDPIRQALVLTADHEMNMVVFTARGLASVGATIGASMLGSMCNLTATFNGGACAQVEALWDDVVRQPDLQAALAARLDRGDNLPGFNHLSYPAGDPRAAALLALCDTLAPLPPIAQAVERLTGWKPAVDFGLVALRRALGAPREAALALQLGGRCVGIIAHVLEQRRSGQRIIARASYVGP